MTATPQVPWLDRDEEQTWRSLRALMTWLPVRLDTQLREDSGLSLTEYRALAQISEAPGRAIRLSDLAAGAHMTLSHLSHLSHLSRVITRLEKQGWVTRTPDPQDGRFTLGHLTDAGQEKVDVAAPGHVRAVRGTLFDHLSAEQSSALGQAAQLIADAVAPGHGADPPGRGVDPPGRRAEAMSQEEA